MTGKIKKRSLAVVLLAAVFCLNGCGAEEMAAVKAGVTQSPYYQLGDTWWDHGGIEEYYFN